MECVQNCFFPHDPFQSILEQRCPNKSWTLMIIWLLWDEMHHYLHLMSVKVEQNPLWRPHRELMAELEFETQSSAHSPGWNHFPLGSAEQPWLSLALQFWSFIMPVHHHSRGNLKKLNQKIKAQIHTVALCLKQQKEVPHLHRLFSGMMKLNEIAYFHFPNALFFVLWKPHFFLVISSVYPLGKTPLMLGTVGSYTWDNCQARTGMTTHELEHCCPAECGMDPSTWFLWWDLGTKHKSGSLLLWKLLGLN